MPGALRLGKKMSKPMTHPTESIPSPCELFIEDLGQVSGGQAKTTEGTVITEMVGEGGGLPPISKVIGEGGGTSPFTEMVGEGGGLPPFSKIAGEGGGKPPGITTLAIGEEGGGNPIIRPL